MTPVESTLARARRHWAPPPDADDGLPPDPDPAERLEALVARLEALVDRLDERTAP